MYIYYIYIYVRNILNVTKKNLEKTDPDPSNHGNFKRTLNRPRFVFTTDGDRGGWFFDADPKRRYGFLAAPWFQHVINEGVM